MAMSDLYEQGVAAARAGDFVGAQALLAECLARTPGHAEALNAQGIVQQRLGRPEAAVELHARAAALKPGYGAAHANLGAALAALGHVAEALAAYDAAAAADPANAECHYNCGILLQGRGRMAEAADCYARALARRPAYPEARNNLGIALRELGRLDAAIASYRAALAQAPANAEAHHNLGMALLEAGDLEEGWREHEWRLAVGVTPPRHTARPRWQGGDVAGKTVLVWAEQGFGDTINFARYLPLLAARGARVLFEAHRPLLRLFAGMAGVDLLPFGEPPPPFDMQVPLLSLPLLCGTRTLADIPAAVPYLDADPALVAVWRRRFEGLPRPLVGFAWAGNPEQKNDRNRSIPFEVAARLERAGGTCVSLQVGRDAGRLAGAFDAAPFLADFAETAAAMRALDLVVTVDTSVAHLAGALGVPVWTMLCFAPDWRYLRDREDCPWYPGMRLFRQGAPGDWDGVLERVGAEWRSLSMQHG
jgi:tetratricopeptide (TPR) repeat protein